ncbi:hypothetical protein MCOR29_009644 [Pyricularia oryzae]|nr:hypothetical protein MCOR29_009644 [Pyricularia oryzae]KAI6470512.1 hypothetical protein MCOR17_003522 [Pyricularia oryzae]KAI6578424.1 hypothetical protein MCOR04_006422 [Pyricularia oryzae]
MQGNPAGLVASTTFSLADNPAAVRIFLPNGTTCRTAEAAGEARLHGLQLVTFIAQLGGATGNHLRDQARPASSQQVGRAKIHVRIAATAEQLYSRVEVFCRLRREGFDTDLSSNRLTDMPNHHEPISLCMLSCKQGIIRDART